MTMRKNLSPALFRKRERGFTLVEMIVVMVITGIIGGMVAVFLRAPVQGYVDSARRAELTDVADTALRRIGRDLRLALPNSVRVTGACDGAGSCFIEFLPTKGGGRYRAGPGGSGNQLLIGTADTSFEVLGPMPDMVAGATPDQIVVYNLGITGADAYAGSNRTAVFAIPAGAIANITAMAFPFDSPGHRFHVITTPVSYVCDGAGALWRYWGYAIQDVQTKTDSITELDVLIPDVNHRALQATNVSTCLFKYQANVVAQRSGLTTMFLGMTRDGESVTLYSASHVSNQP